MAVLAEGLVQRPLLADRAEWLLPLGQSDQDGWHWLSDEPLPWEAAEPDFTHDLETAADLANEGFLSTFLGDRPWIVDGPVVPEPMVFDMVRPMHARRGELEVNTLAVVPLNRRGEGVDWAPEIEYAIADGIGLEFELPFLDERLVALKFAYQHTFGVGMDNQLIHGVHTIYEYEFDDQVSILTPLYMVGMRLDSVWSVMGMFGFRATMVGATRTHDIELIQNVSVFADITERWILGVETNMAHFLDGPSTLLLVPQAHWTLSDNWNFQFGGGIQASARQTIPIFATRLVYEF